MGCVTEFEGYAARFNSVDLGGDVVMPGAFAASILRRGGIFPMLLLHDPRQPIGHCAVREDEHGLHVLGRLLDNLPPVGQLLQHLRAGSINGLSIGFRTISSQHIGPVRCLALVDLWEISVVDMPMHPGARLQLLPESQQQRRHIA